MQRDNRLERYLASLVLLRTRPSWIPSFKSVQWGVKSWKHITMQ